MSLGHKAIVTGENPEIILDLGLDVLIARHNEAPVDGAAGTLAGKAGKGSVIFSTNGNQYRNTGTKDAPVWEVIGS